jgi:hypothetical protein
MLIPIATPSRLREASNVFQSAASQVLAVLMLIALCMPASALAQTFIGDDDGDGVLVIDTFEGYTVGDPLAGTGLPYFVFSGNGASVNGITASNDAASVNSSTISLEASLEGGDGTGFLGFGRGVNSEANPEGYDVSGLGTDPYVTMSLQSTATVQYGLIIELQEDTNGNGAFEGGSEDNFRYTHTVNPNTSGYEELSIQLSQITAFNMADDGVLDPTRIGNIVFLIAGDQAGIPAQPFTVNVDELGFTDDGSALPVELAGFTVRASGNDAVLSWQTLSETNNDRFDVQLASRGAPFRTVGTVRGAGTTTEMQRYQFRVSSLDPGVHQFRLRQVDIDGTASLSDIRTLSIGTDAPFTMMKRTANPVRMGQAATMSFIARDSQPVRVELFNVLGQRVRTISAGTTSAGAETMVRIPTGNLASGQYFVRMTGASFTQTERLSVIR